LGEFRWLELEPTTGLIKPFEGWSVTVRDRASRDLPLAKSKTPTLGEVDIEIPAVDAVGHPFLSTNP
jgi:hypothetical protein